MHLFLPISASLIVFFPVLHYNEYIKYADNGTTTGGES